MNRMKTGAYLVLLALILPLCLDAKNQLDRDGANLYQAAYSYSMEKQIDSVVSDLQAFIPEYMAENQIPGCAVTLIYDHRIAWSAGFGNANTFTGKPVQKETLFEVASNSKIITAYISLLLVDQGILSLDQPLDSYLYDPWLPDPQYRDSITLRHVLSHSSGLGHSGMNRDLLFPPGSGYSYSNLGFSYLQNVIEHITGNSLEEVATELIFEPLNMSSTSYSNPKILRKQLANGHVPGSYVIRLTGIVILISLLAVFLPGMLIHRLLRKRWIPAIRIVTGGFLLSLILWLMITFLFFGIIGWLKYAWQIALFGLSFIATSTGLICAGRTILRQIPNLSKGNRRLFLIIWSITVTMGLGWFASKIPHIPVPRWSSVRPMAAASLRTTTTDMATFLLELADPQYLHDSLASQLQQSQIQLHPDISWGLGTGILHGPQGIALWQWGQNVDFQSLTIIYPDHGFGTAVLTNSDWTQPDVAIEIAQRAMSSNLESVRRASHLEFSFQPEN